MGTAVVVILPGSAPTIGARAARPRSLSRTIDTHLSDAYEVAKAKSRSLAHALASRQDLPVIYSPMSADFISAEDWVNIVGMLLRLWGFALSMVTFALTLLLAHAAIPSMITTRHLPARLGVVRPLLYVVSLAALTVAIFFFSNFVARLQIIYVDVYPRVVI